MFESMCAYVLERTYLCLCMYTPAYMCVYVVFLEVLSYRSENRSSLHFSREIFYTLQVLSLEQLKRSDDLGSLIHRQVFCQTHKDEKVT